MKNGRNGKKLWQCLYCGIHKNVKDGRYSRKFCSRKCYEAFNNKKCSCCGNNFIAIFSNQKTCNNCRKHPKPYYDKEKIIKRKIKCKICNKIIGTERIRKKYNTKPVNSTNELCEACKKKNIKKKKKNYKNCSLYMKKNNPMYNKDIRAKASKTIKKKIKEGEIIYKRGKEHPLYKGNRGFYADCRSMLYKEWVIKILTRDKFKCTICKKQKNLQVHHIRPFRKIVKIILCRNRIKNNKNINPNSFLYWNLIDQIIKEHNLDDGITVCNKCHGDIDERYRRYKGKGKKNL